VGLGDIGDVLYFDVSVEDAFRLDDGDGTLLAETVAAGEVDINIGKAEFSDLFLHSGANFEGFSGDTTGTVAEFDGATVIRCFVLFYH